MNRERAKELLPIIEAYANGAVIEVKRDHGGWTVSSSPEFCEAGHYRIKPVPREFVLEPFRPNTIAAPDTMVAYPIDQGYGYKLNNYVEGVIKVREVLE